MEKALKENDLTLKLVAFLILLLASLVSTYTLFLPGLPMGDDLNFHLAMIEDVYIGFQRGFFGLTTNHVFFGGFALDTFAFYGPFPHHFTALLLYCFSWAGATSISSYKFVIFTSAFIGSIFSYLLGKKITKNNVSALIAGVAFVFMPYRIFCALCRAAFSEVIAMSFIPLVFYGLYSIAHDEKFSINPYVSLSIGAIVIVLSHPFTGVFTATFAILYIICNISFFIKKRDGFSIWPWVVGTVIVTFFGVAFSFFNALNTLSTGMYTISDPVIAWTTIGHVKGSTANSTEFSGIFNLIWISSMQGTSNWNNQSVSFITFGVCTYIISVGLVIIADQLLKSLKCGKYVRHLSSIIGFILPVFLLERAEVYFGIGFAIIIYFFISTKIKEQEVNDYETGNLLKNPDFYFVVVSLIACLLLIYVPQIWNYVPSVYYQCQFAWRIWSMVAFLLVMLICLIIKQAKPSIKINSIFAVLISSLLVFSMGTLEKRTYYEVGRNVVLKFNEEEVASLTYSGAQNEMVPLIYRQTDYQSEYSNSLYTNVRNAINNRKNFIRSIDDYYDPAFLTGQGSAEITYFNTPNASFDITITSEIALVQFPQFYEEGYVATFSNSSSKIEPKNIDGLIAFELPKGSYTLNIEFKGPTIYRVFRPFFYISIAALICGGIYGTIYSRHLYNKKVEEENK